MSSLASKSSSSINCEAVILNRERVLQWLSQLSYEAQQMRHYSAAARCEELMGKEIGMFVDRSALLWEIDPDKMTPEQLDCIADHLIAKSLGNNPEAIAEDGADWSLERLVQSMPSART
jgi:hypothetical protein